MTTFNTYLRAADATFERGLRLAPHLPIQRDAIGRRRAPGAADVLRLAMDRGLDLLERELAGGSAQ